MLLTNTTSSTMKQIFYILLPGLLLSLGLQSCLSSGNDDKAPTADQPNILWIYVEDICPFLSCYGYDINQTPHIDKLAENGVLFEKAFTPSPVCSPTRSGIITGMMPTTIGVHNHHSSRTVESAIFLPDEVKLIPDLFRDAGYYVYNNGKDDYNFIYDRASVYEGPFNTHFWYTFYGTGSWRDEARKEGQPFFGQIQLEGGKYTLHQEHLQKAYKERIPEEERMDPSVPELPPYYADFPFMREDWALHFDGIKMTDLDVRDIVAKLREDGLLENTIIFFFSDPGYKGTRHKQFCYDGGIQVPLIVAYYGTDERIQKGLRRKDLVSLIDVGPTSLALAGIPVPGHMEGKDLFAGDYHRDYVITTRDRCDFTIDRIRSVRTDKYKYIKNFNPERSYNQPSYRDTRPEFTIAKEMFEKGELNEVQARYWLPTKPGEEFYDLENDPHEINNLADDPAYAEELKKHREILENWIRETDDQGQYPEKQEGLRYMYSRWGERCVNPEFDYVKKNPRDGAPKTLNKI